MKKKSKTIFCRMNRNHMAQFEKLDGFVVFNFTRPLDGKIFRTYKMTIEPIARGEVPISDKDMKACGMKGCFAYRECSHSKSHKETKNCHKLTPCRPCASHVHSRVTKSLIVPCHPEEKPRGLMRDIDRAYEDLDRRRKAVEKGGPTPAVGPKLRLRRFPSSR
jgi:hypothetical protein